MCWENSLLGHGCYQWVTFPLPKEYPKLANGCVSLNSDHRLSAGSGFLFLNLTFACPGLSAWTPLAAQEGTDSTAPRTFSVLAPSAVNLCFNLLTNRPFSFFPHFTAEIVL